MGLFCSNSVIPSVYSKDDSALSLYKITHGLNPNYLSEPFENTSEQHNYAIRGAEQNLALPQRHKGEFIKSSISYREAAL